MGEQRLLYINVYENETTPRDNIENNEINDYEKKSKQFRFSFFLIVIDFGLVKYSTRKPHDYLLVSTTRFFFI